MPAVVDCPDGMGSHQDRDEVYRHVSATQLALNQDISRSTVKEDTTYADQRNGFLQVVQAVPLH
jgi:hypothetical protein